MIKFLKNRYIVFLIACMFFTFSIFTNVKVSANAGAPYGKQITIQQILSDYQYFIYGNATLLNHNVGGIVAGGDVEVGNFGDGAIEPSYFGNIVSVSNYNGTSTSHFLSGSSSYSGYIGLPVYYKTTEVSGLSSSFVNYTNATPFINLGSAFSALVTQSFDMTNGAYTVTTGNITGDMYNGYMLNLPLGTYKSIIIPKTIYDQVNYIKLTGISNLNDFVENEYSISVVGVSDVSISFGYTTFNDSQNTGKKGILFSDGQSFNNSNSLKNISSGNVAGGQLNTNGMKLIWNFPNAVTVISDYTAGHIVAPNADVTLANGTGNFEGGIIAKSVVNNSAEGHFYPYMAIGESYTPGISITPSPGASVTPSPGISITPSPGVSITPSPGISITPSPGVSITPSPGASVTPSPGASITPSLGVSITPSPGASVTPIDISVEKNDGKGSKDSSGMPKTGDNADLSIVKYGLIFFTIVLLILTVADIVLWKKYLSKRNKK